MIKQTITKYSLDNNEQKEIVNAIKRGTHDFNDLIQMVNDFIDGAFQAGIEHNQDQDQ